MILKGNVWIGMKKVAVMLIAGAMLLGVVPVAMITMPTTVRAEGEFLRLMPSEEYALAEKERGSGLWQLDEDTRPVGEGYDSFLRFDLGAVAGKEVDSIHEATLRLTLLRMPARRSGSIRVWLMQEGETQSEVSETPLEVLLATATVSPQEQSDAAVLEVDLTEHLKKWVEEERRDVSLHLDGLGGEVIAVLAGRDYADPAFRPCLKVVTGSAEDPDRDDLTKTWLADSAVVGRTEGDWTIRSGQSAYWKFGLHRENIQGAVYQAELRLFPIGYPLGSKIRLSLLENQNWNGTDVANGLRPEGKRTLLYEGNVGTEDGTLTLDLTEAFYRAYLEGADSIALELTCMEGEFTLAEEERKAPKLALWVSDDEDIAAVMEAAAYPYGENASEKEIVEDLPQDYTAQNGKRVKLTWAATHWESGQSASDLIKSSGAVQRPLWFEGAKTVLARAVISSGEYQHQLEQQLVLPAEERPDYSAYHFDDMIAPGTRESEKQQAFESVGTVARSRWEKGRIWNYRAMKAEGAMVLNLATEPQGVQYLTVKLSGEEMPCTLKVQDLMQEDNPPLLMETASVSEEEGFFYLTCPLPPAYTEGRDYVTLKLTMMAEDPEATCDLYGAYITSSAYFDPMTFVEQGESVVKKEGSNSHLYRWLKDVYATARERWERISATEGPSQAASMDEVYILEESDSCTIMVRGEEEQLALTLKEGADRVEILRETAYDSARAEALLHTYCDGKVGAVDYGIYRFFFHWGEQEEELPWQEEGMAGIYRDMNRGRYDQFLQEGQMADTDALPEGITVQDGKARTLAPGEVAVFRLAAEPVYHAEWKVSRINGKAVSDLDWKEGVAITSVTLHNQGSIAEDAETYSVYCGVYDRGMLVQMVRKNIEVGSAWDHFRVTLPQSVTAKPGQIVKIFLERAGEDPDTMTPILELP